MAKKTALLIKLLPGQAFRSYCTGRIPVTNREIIARRNALFTEEKARQTELVRRVEKIRVNYVGNPANCTLIMNKDLSSPADCAKHLPEHIGKMSFVALVNGKAHDMHSPLKEDCELSLVPYKEPDVERMRTVNKVFWRSCSYLLGYAIERAFKEDYTVHLHSWPAPSISSGSFVYDALLPFENWRPSARELLIIANPVHKLIQSASVFERLEVEASFAKEIFAGNSHKREQVDDFAETDENHKVVLYRCGDHVDMSRGPMIANAGLIKNYDVASVHALETQIGLVYRFQGIAIPNALTMSPFAHKVVKERAQTLNTIGLPEHKAEYTQQFVGGAEPKLMPEPEVDDDNEHSSKVHKAAQ